jgi:hypothetical protein
MERRMRVKGVFMTTSPGPIGLNNHHRDTLMKIFQHPTSHNIEWRNVVSLLEVVGTIEEHRDGRFQVELRPSSSIVRSTRTSILSRWLTFVVC